MIDCSVCLFMWMVGDIFDVLLFVIGKLWFDVMLVDVVWLFFDLVGMF